MALIVKSEDGEVAGTRGTAAASVQIAARKMTSGHIKHITASNTLQREHGDCMETNAFRMPRGGADQTCFLVGGCCSRGLNLLRSFSRFYPGTGSRGALAGVELMSFPADGGAHCPAARPG
jgi:hypothetical protein